MSQLDDSDSISIGNVVVVKDANKVIEYFTVQERVVSFYKDGEEVSTAAIGDTITAEGFASSKDAVLVVAQYCGDGLKAISISPKKPDANGKLSTQFTVDAETTEIKTMLLKSIDSLNPEMEVTPIGVVVLDQPEEAPAE